MVTPAPLTDANAAGPAAAAVVVAGSVNMDLVARVAHIPSPGETVLGAELARHHGGKGANQAVAAARLGAAVYFHGAIGDDAFGRELADGLRAEGIDTDGLVRVPGASGCALINVADSGENAISVLPGANRYAPRPGPQAQATLSGGAWLMLQLETPLATATAWAQAARGVGARVLLNAAPVSALPLALLEAVDVLVVNEDEMASLRAQADGDAAVRDALAARPWTVVTCGGRGVWAQPAAGERIVWPGQPVVVADTTGAGDAFCGALAAALAFGMEFTVALALANRCAALSCTVAGARGGMPRSWPMLPNEST